MTDDRDRVFRVERDGATIVAEEHGTGHRSFVLVHGIGMGRTVFTDLVDRLGTDVRTIALDLPGYGDAPEPPRTPTIERLADLVAALLRERHLGDVTLVGHSMGSQVAAEVAARHPKLVDGLVLVGPTVNPRERTAAQQILRLAQDLVIESPKVIVRGGREYLRAGPNLRLKMRAMLRHRPEHAFPLIEAPTLVLRGQDDPVAPRAWCETVTRLIPHARLVEIRGHGHETMIRDAAPAVAAIRAFFDGDPFGRNGPGSPADDERNPASPR